MHAFLKELFTKLNEYPVNKGDFCLINVEAYYQKTKFLLTSKQKNLSSFKSRPLIVTDVNAENVRFVVTTTNVKYRKTRPEISIKDCEIKKQPEDCNGLNLRRKTTWLFAKKTKSKKFRFFYELDIHTLKQLQSTGDFKICGKCKKNVIDEIIFIIEKFGDYL